MRALAGDLRQRYRRIDVLAMKVMEREHSERLVGVTPEAACDQLVWLAAGESQDFEPAGDCFVKRRVGRAHRITYYPRHSDELWQRTATLVNRS